MTIAELLQKMIAYSEGNMRDIMHLTCVWAYAKTIGEQEGLDPETQFLLEAAAVTHDIACPLCREKYGSADGKMQEKEGVPLVRAFLADTDLSPEQTERIAWLVGHHHTLDPIGGIDHQILIEADYVVNAMEKGYDRHNIENFIRRGMKTKSGIRLAKAVFQV